MRAKFENKSAQLEATCREKLAESERKFNRSLAAAREAMHVSEIQQQKLTSQINGLEDELRIEREVRVKVTQRACEQQVALSNALASTASSQDELTALEQQFLASQEQLCEAHRDHGATLQRLQQMAAADSA